MRLFTGGVAHIAATIEEDLRDRDTGLQKPHVLGLAIYWRAPYQRDAPIQLKGWLFCRVKLARQNQKNVMSVAFCLTVVSTLIVS